VDGDEVDVVVWLCADGVVVCDCVCDWAMAPNANAVVAASAIASVLILISECISPARSSRLAHFGSRRAQFFRLEMNERL
jgi:hypothetical protein